MAAINLNHADALDIQTKADLVLTDPPFDMSAKQLKQIFNNIESDHLVLITTMKQLIDFVSITDWVLSFDFVLDIVSPKKSKNIQQPHYTHATGAYLTKNKAKSRFNRKLRQRSDTFDNNGYWPSILRAPRENMHEHSMAKNEQAVTDILGCFDVQSVYDPFAGRGTTGFAALEIDMDCELTEMNAESFKKMQAAFRFIT